MTNNPNAPLKTPSKLGIILISVIVVILTAGFFVYLNINKMLSKALANAFESSLAAEVYELKFKNLRANPLQGSISVLDVSLQRKENPDKSYPYINSWVKLKTDKLVLENVDILLLLRANKLVLEKIAIISPDLELDLNSQNPTFLPFGGSNSIIENGENKVPDSYLLREFELVNAKFRLINSLKNRDFTVANFNLSFKELDIDHNEREELFFLRELEISLDKFSGSTKEDALQQVNFSDFRIKFDSVDARKNLDTLIFNFQNFTSGVHDLDIRTRDSLFHITMSSFDLSYRDQTIQMEKLSFKPNVSNAEIQRNYRFQHTQFSGTVGSINFSGVNFDSMIYANSLFIEEVSLDSISALIYKDNTKAKDLNHFPKYPGQLIKEIRDPILIKTVKATQVNVTNEERKPDGSLARVHVNNGTLEAKNITNLAPGESLTIQAGAFLAGKVEFKLNLAFSYSLPQFAFDGRLLKFELTEINPITKAYTPIEFKAGTSDEIKFSGIAQATRSTGNLTFLYHDLNINLELNPKENWINSIVSFGANAVLRTNNPASENLPPRSVKFLAERDMNKGFVNLIIKSILDGMKETMNPSKENRREYKDTKNDARNDR